MWEEAIKFINAHSSFVVTTHVHPDGDALGSQLALGLFLERKGKRAVMLNDDPVPQVYAFLNQDSRIGQYDPVGGDALLADCQAAIVADGGALERVGKVGEAIAKRGLPTLCIDHHWTNGGFATLNVIVPTAPSSASLVLDLMKAMGEQPTPREAEALYVGLATDTGWFRFPNVTADAFRQAADLVEFGAEPARIYEMVYENLSWPRTRLLAKAMATLESDADGRIAYFKVTRDMLRQTGATAADVEGFVDKMRELAGVEVIMMFREQDDGTTRVSLRAKHDADVGSLAVRFGGGGHRRAAGITLHEPLDSAIPKILAAARQTLAESQTRGESD